MKIDVRNRSGKRVLPDGILVSDNATVGDLKERFYELKPKLYPTRQRWTLPAKEGQRSGQVLRDQDKLKDVGIEDGASLIFKDLGPQIGYATVFFWEYFGPLVIYVLMYLFPGTIYPSYAAVPKSTTQTLAVVYWIGHFSKRIYETFYVHKFSHATMPLFNLAKNCSYYWAFAAYVGYFVNHPLYTSPPIMQTYIALTFSLMCQIANYTCHVMLSSLRQPGGPQYVIPSGFLFDYITCPNYTAEILGWIGFTIATQTLPAAFFTVVGAGQMAQWAIGKHARLRKMFNGQDGKPRYPRRWIMLPPFL